VFGPWVHAPSSQLDIFVSPSGSNSNSGQTPSAPVQTLAQALSNADSLQAATGPTAPRGVTINVMPGTYTVSTALSVPAFGISIEAYYSNATAGTAPPTILSNVSAVPTDVFVVDRAVGSAASAAGIQAQLLPPTSFRGLTIDLAPGASSNVTGISILPGNNLSNMGTQTQTSVGVYQCTIRNLNFGIVTVSNSAFLELDEFVDNDIQGTAGANSLGIIILGVGPSSCLCRSNRIRDFSQGIEALNLSGTSGVVRPRILSNFISACDFGVQINDASAQVVNNTIAFAHSNAQPAGAITYIPNSTNNSSGETLVVVNNLFFNPVVPGAALIPGVLTQTGAPGALVLDSNDFEPTGGLVLPIPTPAPSATNMSVSTPNFVSSTSPFDLHLTTSSPSASSSHIGNFNFVDPGLTSRFTIGASTILADVNFDVDTDARTHQPAASGTRSLHRGADELMTDGLRIQYSATALPNTLCPDPFGNVIQDSAGNSNAMIDLTGPAGASYSLWLCQQFTGNPTLQHTVFPPQGSWALDTTTGNSAVIATGTLSSSGTATAKLSLGKAIPAGFLEAEMYLQLAIQRTDATAAFSNRLRIDLDRN
jgi:hypothetical protein